MTAGVAGRLLDSLDPEQRAAAVLPDGPAQILAPAGSGKTTTLIARLAVLLERGVARERILVVTFNRDAAQELSARIASRLAASVPDAAQIQVRTLHALGRQILLDAGDRARLVADRFPLLRIARRQVAQSAVDAIETALAAFKLEQHAPDPASLPVIDAYQALLAARGAIDFDDLIARALALLRLRADLRARWQARFSHLLVDEYQDVDAAQAALIGLLAEPERNLFVVGDDDQTIYAWRLADVRRILNFSRSYPDASIVMLATNYRCPRDVVDASRRLIDHNRERFWKRIEPGPGARHGCSILALRTDDHRWPERLAALVDERASRGRRVCLLARTTAELMPMALALARAGVPHALAHPSPLDAAPVARLLEALPRESGPTPHAALRSLRALHRWARGSDSEELSPDDETALDAVLAWSVGFRTTAAFLVAVDAARSRLAQLRRADAQVHLMTVHSAKGLEFPVVVVLGFEEGRFPNRRALLGAADAGRALEEERRLAYVALTRASEELILAFDPARPSRFLAELRTDAARQRPTSAATTER